VALICSKRAAARADTIQLRTRAPSRARSLAEKREQIVVDMRLYRADIPRDS